MICELANDNADLHEEDVDYTACGILAGCRVCRDGHERACAACFATREVDQPGPLGAAVIIAVIGAVHATALAIGIGQLIVVSVR